MHTHIGRYEILKALGAGPEGPRYLARDPALGRDVAIRLFDPADDGHRAEIASRLRAIARLRHRNIAEVYDIGDHDGRPFVAMEHVVGETFARVLARKPPPSLAERLALVEQLCDGLAHAHAAGVVHRSLDPAEVVIDGGGVLKIVDFGMPLPPSEMTATGGPPSRVNYLAPEQIAGQPIDERTDIFALGAVLYEALALQQAFPGDIASGVLNRILGGPPPLAQRPPTTDPELLRIVDHALARAPEQRYRDAADMRRDIARVRQRLLQDGDHTGAIEAPDAVPMTPGGWTTAAGDSGSPARERMRQAQIAQLIDASRRALDAGDLEMALDAAERAAVLDPEHPLVRESIERAGSAAAQAERERLEQARLAAEAARHHEAQRRHREEEEARRRADLEQRRRAAEESRYRAEQEEQRLRAEEQQAQRRAEQEARLREEEERRRRAREEELRAERDAERRRAEEDGRRRQAAADARADASRAAEGDVRSATGQASSSLPPPPGEAGRGGFDLEDLATIRHPTSPAAPRPVPTGAPTPRQTYHREGITPVDDVQFTVYRPKAIRPATRRPMFVFTHLVDARHPQSQPAPIEEVRKRIAAALGAAAPAFRESMAEGRHGVPAGGQITLLPEVPGVTFTPARHAFRWELDIHEHRFEMEAAAPLDGQVARGQLTVYLGAILLAEVPLAIRIDSTLHDEADQAQEWSTARAYRKIFASYSRRDAGIVEQFERYVAALGDSYLRDVRNLRAGEQWEDGLRRLIEEADVFQLFWSWNAMRSPNVRREWEYAISLNRPAFVRPTYWEMPLPESAAEGLPPPALRQLHFHRMVAEVETDAASPAVQEVDSGVVRRREFEAPARTEEARPSIAAEARLPDRLSVPAVYPVPSGPSAAPAAPSPVRPASRGRLLRFAGVAAGLMLTAIAGTLVWQNGMLDRGPTAATGSANTGAPAETPTAAPPPLPAPLAEGVPPGDRASIEGLVSAYVDAFNKRDKAAVRAIDPGFAGFADSGSASAPLSVADIAIVLSSDGTSATVSATLEGGASRGPAASPPAQPTLRWSLRKQGTTWRVVE